MLALTHLPSPRINDAERAYVARSGIDYNRALRQHADYCKMLSRCGLAVRTLDVNRDLPDCVFIEDTAIVLDEVAVLASMGVESRRAQPAGGVAGRKEGLQGHRLRPRAAQGRADMR